MIRRMIVGVMVLVLSGLCLCLYLLVSKGNPSEEGIEYLEKGQYEEAVSQFEEAVKEEVNVGDAYRGIGIARWELEDYEGAKDAFQKALEQESESPFMGTIYNFLGNCELKTGNPQSAQNYFQLVALEQSGDWENAKAKVTEYAAEYPDDANVLKEQQFLQTR